VSRFSRAMGTHHSTAVARSKYRSCPEAYDRRFHGMEEVVGSIPTRSTILSITYELNRLRFGNGRERKLVKQLLSPVHFRAPEKEVTVLVVRAASAPIQQSTRKSRIHRSRFRASLLRFPCPSRRSSDDRGCFLCSGLTARRGTALATVKPQPGQWVDASVVGLSVLNSWTLACSRPLRPHRKHRLVGCTGKVLPYKKDASQIRNEWRRFRYRPL
jgi:hypothetical protein